MSTEPVFPVGDAAYDAIYAQERAMIDASELVSRALKASGMSRSDLARTLGVSRGEITARLKGERNITVRKLAETLHALGAQLDLTVLEPPSRRPMTRTWSLAGSGGDRATTSGPWVFAEAYRAR